MSIIKGGLIAEERPWILNHIDFKHNGEIEIYAKTVDIEFFFSGKVYDSVNRLIFCDKNGNELYCAGTQVKDKSFEIFGFEIHKKVTCSETIQRSFKDLGDKANYAVYAISVYRDIWNGRGMYSDSDTYTLYRLPREPRKFASWAEFYAYAIEKEREEIRDFLNDEE
ncbi:MAG: hypothetical protein WCT49_04985 [Candidatus Paceibacterota bacterium]|jgi:hypothetical protein|nr:hypothetical protein [Candidatus Paceibacterota bacterium]